MTPTPTLPQLAIAALQDLTDALWRNPAIPKTPIHSQLIHADTVLRAIRKQYVRPAILQAMSHINPKIQAIGK